MRIRSSRRARLALVVSLGVLVLAPTASYAVTIADVLPLYFDAGGEGFEAAGTSGLPALFSATPGDAWIPAGAAAGLPVRVLSQTLVAEHQNPASPDFADPVIADSVWRIRNESAGNLLSPLLVFTSVDPEATYPVTLPPTGLDGNLVSLLSYSFGGSDFVYGVVPLPDIGNGEVVNVTVRYLVAGNLAEGSPAPLPPLGVSVLASYEIVPEPSTAILLGLGLLLCTGVARRVPGRPPG